MFGNMRGMWGFGCCLIFWGIYGFFGANALDVEPEYQMINISIPNIDNSDINGQGFRYPTQLQANSITVINVIDIPPTVAFMIVQVHTQESTVSLSYTAMFDNKTTVNGSNVGLQVDPQIHEVFVKNEENENLRALVAVVLYTDNAPRPGGCNMEFNPEISPFQRIKSTDSMTEVDAAPASMITNGEQLPCEANSVTYEAYRLYIPEGDFTHETYFASLSKMLTVNDIMKFGEKIPPAVTISQMRRVYSAYPGTGSAYAMIATYNDYSSAYVPAFSYACSPLTNPESCYLLNTTISKVICATIFFIGFILTFIGHGWFCAEMFFLGTIAGGIIGHVFLAAVGFENISTQLGLALLIGSVTGIVSIALWYRFGMPCIAILQASLALGALVASTIYFGIPDGATIFESDANFWVIYAAIMLMVSFILCIFPLSSNIICCAFVGAYTIVLSIDYWLGSNLKYIIINTVRRVIVPGFNVATIHPPIQGKDIWLMVAWVVLALFGINCQRRRLNGRPPFPSPADYTTTITSERMPILSSERRGRRVIVIGENDNVYQGTSWCCK